MPSDADKRTEELHAIQDQISSDIAWLPVVEYKTQWAYSSKLRGMRWYPDNSIRYGELSFD
jgi:peptide/nickel transport system substrate-binding protein